MGCISARGACLTFRTVRSCNQGGSLVWDAPVDANRFDIWTAPAFDATGVRNNPLVWARERTLTYLEAGCSYISAHGRRPPYTTCKVPERSSALVWYAMRTGRVDVQDPHLIHWSRFSVELNRLACVRLPNADAECTVLFDGEVVNPL